MSTPSRQLSGSWDWRQLLALIQLAPSSLSDPKIRSFQDDLARMGYRFQFVTLAGFHSLNASMFNLALGYRNEGMTGYVRLQEEEFALQEEGYSAVRHQHEAGAGYFDLLLETITAGTASTLTLKGSTEETQFDSALLRE